MDEHKRRELGERLAKATGALRSDVAALGRRCEWGMFTDHASAEYVPDVLDGGTMRAALEWAREVTGRPALFVGVVLGQWRALDGDQDAPGVSDVLSDACATEAEAHVALAEWAARNRK